MRNVAVIISRVLFFVPVTGKLSYGFDTGTETGTSFDIDVVIRQETRQTIFFCHTMMSRTNADHNHFVTGMLSTAGVSFNFADAILQLRCCS